MPTRICLLIVLLTIAPSLWSQGDPPSTSSAAASDDTAAADQMAVPIPVSGAGLPLAVTTETPRTNFLRGGLAVEGAYDDSAFSPSTSVNSHIYYVISPMLMFSTKGERTHLDLSYKPGFRFYQQDGSSSVDHDLTLGLEYLISPHVTFQLHDSFLKAPNLLNRPDQLAIGSASGVIEKPNNVILVPISDLISNYGLVEVTYQFSPRSIIGVKGTLIGFWYPNRSNVSFVVDSISEAGETFYARRMSKKVYVGTRYEWQRLLTHPETSRTQTQSIVLFGTVFVRPTLSVSIFAGPQLSDTHRGATLPYRIISPEAGASIAWQGTHNGVLLSYSQQITSGGGLAGAVRSSGGAASLLHQFPGKFTARVEASYGSNSILDLSVPGSRGHIVSGGVSIQHSLAQHLGMEVGYTRMHQTYNGVSTTSNPLWTPDGTRAWASVTYNFEKALGR